MHPRLHTCRGQLPGAMSDEILGRTYGANRGHVSVFDQWRIISIDGVRYDGNNYDRQVNTTPSVGVGDGAGTWRL